MLLAGFFVEARAAVFPSFPFSDRSAGTTAAKFLKFPAGARAEAMGQSMAAGAAGSEAVFWNPAGLLRAAPLALASDVSVGYTRLLETAFTGATAYSRSFGRWALAGGFLYNSQDKQSAFDAQGNAAGSFTPNDIAVLASGAYGWENPRSIFVGATVKFIRSQLDAASGATGAVDLGVQVMRVVDTGEGPIDVGVAIVNLGPPMRLGGDSDPLPFEFRAGMLWHLAPYLRAAADMHMAVDADPYASVGFEGHVKLGGDKGSRAFLRTGYNQRYHRGLDGFAGMTAGAGADLVRWRLDYAWVPFGELGMAHRLSLGFRF